MSIKTQASLEAQLAQHLRDVETQKISPEQAFGNLEDWILQLGNYKAFLHPNLQQWMWYDQLHDEWVFAGCGVREAILLVLDKTRGIKKLPYPDDVSSWCIVLQDGQPQGPLRIDVLRNKLQQGDLKPESLVWTTRANDWLPLISVRLRRVLFGESPART